MIKQNVTLSIDKDLLREAKIIAAKNNISLSRLMIETLKEKLETRISYDSASARQLKILKKGLNLGSCGNITSSREELHERR